MTDTTIHRLIPSADTSHESAREWYENYGWHLDTEYAGSVEIQAIEYDWLDDDDDDAVIARLTGDDTPYLVVDDYDDDASEGYGRYHVLLRSEAETIVQRARSVRSAAEGIESLLDEAVEAYQRGDVEACIEALEDASRQESEHGGDDPATTDLRAKLIDDSEPDHDAD